jgi:hypothetical protein
MVAPLYRVELSHTERFSYSLVPVMSTRMKYDWASTAVPTRFPLTLRFATVPPLPVLRTSMPVFVWDEVLFSDTDRLVQDPKATARFRSYPRMKFRSTYELLSPTPAGAVWT